MGLQPLDAEPHPVSDAEATMTDRDNAASAKRKSARNGKEAGWLYGSRSLEFSLDSSILGFPSFEKVDFNVDCFLQSRTIDSDLGSLKVLK